MCQRSKWPGAAYLPSTLDTRTQGWKHRDMVVRTSWSTWTRLAVCVGVPLGCSDPGIVTAEATSSSGGGVGTSAGAASGDEAQGTTARGSSDASTTGADGGSTVTGDPVEPDLPDPFRSGTRLRARHFDGGDHDALVSWFDLELGQECWFQPSEDGEFRCMPGRPIAYSAGNVSLPRLWYLDAACTEPVASIGACTELDHLLVPLVYAETCGPTPQRSHAVGGIIATPPGIYTAGPAGCVPSMVPNDELHALTAIDEATLVRATPTRFEVDGALGVEVLYGEDGSSQWYADVDLARDVACDRRTVDGVALCASRNAVTKGDIFYHHPDCDNSAAAPMRGAETCARPDFAWSDDRPYSVATEYDPISVRYRDGNSCNPLAPELPLRFFLTDILAPASLPALARTNEGSGRLRLRRDATLGGDALLHELRWDDVDTGQPCRPLRVGADAYVCGPEVPVLSRWADDACTVPAAALPGIPPADAAMLEVVVTGTTLGPSCEGEWAEARQVLGPYDGTLYSDLLGCHSVEPTSDAVVLLGDPVDPDMLPPLPVVTD